MRLWLVSLGVLLGLVATPAFSQTSNNQRLEAEIYPILRNYQKCANRHLDEMLSQYPNGRFEEHEASIRPACGSYIEDARARMLRMGYAIDAVNAEIRIYYNTLRPMLIARFNEGQRVPSRQREAAAPTDEGIVRRVRETVLKELDADYRSCVNTAIRTIVPYSTEGAETLVQAVMAKCMDYERKRTQFIEALFDVPHEQASRAVENALQNEKRRVLAEIVTIRAALNKAVLEQSKPADLGATGGIGLAKDF